MCLFLRFRHFASHDVFICDTARPHHVDASPALVASFFDLAIMFRCHVLSFRHGNVSPCDLFFLVRGFMLSKE